MLEKVINGYTVIAHTHNMQDGLYWILGARRIGPADYEYAVAGLRNFDLDTSWCTNGYYTTSIRHGFERYSERGFC